MKTVSRNLNTLGDKPIHIELSLFFSIFNYLFYHSIEHKVRLDIILKIEKYKQKNVKIRNLCTRVENKVKIKIEISIKRKSQLYF